MTDPWTWIYVLILGGPTLINFGDRVTAWVFQVPIDDIRRDRFKS